MSIWWNLSILLWALSCLGFALAARQMLRRNASIQRECEFLNEANAYCSGRVVVAESKLESIYAAHLTGIPLGLCRSQRQVQEFHHVCGHPIGAVAHLPEDPKLLRLRVMLVVEEALEFATALGFSVEAHMSEEGQQGFELKDFGRACRDFASAIDALCDIKYVVDGSAVTFGVNLQPFTDEVHRANLTKGTGHDEALHGKRQKPANFVPPRIAEMLKMIEGVPVEKQAEVLAAAGFGVKVVV